MSDLTQGRDKKITPVNIRALKDNEIFVFGSNPTGFHTSGAACNAIQWGAVMGQGSGL